jgi:hypothetical protein
MSGKAKGAMESGSTGEVAIPKTNSNLGAQQNQPTTQQLMMAFIGGNSSQGSVGTVLPETTLKRSIVT